MFAIVRTGGKQYRVAAGDKITVEKLPGAVGDRIDISDVLLAGEGADLTSTAGLIVAAEIVAQGKGEKIIIFKKKRRHNYRRKNGHRQFHTLLRITAIGNVKAEAAPKKVATEQPAPTPTEAAAPAAPAAATPAPAKKAAPKKAVAPAATKPAADA